MNQIRMEPGLRVRGGGPVVVYVRRLRPLALLLLSRLMDFFFPGVCDFDVATR